MEKDKKKVVRDHYRVLGLPSGKEGTKLNERAIKKAYRAKALQLHPDKRPNDPYANDKFQRLQSSYVILMDPKARKAFDASLVRLDNKPSSEPKRKTSDEPKRKTSSEPKRKTSDEPERKTSDEPEKNTSDEQKKQRRHEEYLFALGYVVIVLGPLLFPVGRSCAGLVIRGVCLYCSMEGLKYHQQVENVWTMVVRAGSYFKRNPRNASESQGDEYEDIEDWVMV